VVEAVPVAAGVGVGESSRASQRLLL